MSDNLSNLWCKFILSEGVMPASLSRIIKKNNENPTNTKLLAQLLQKRESFSDPLYPELSEVAKRAFLNDDELNNWLVSMDSILDIIIAFSDSDKNTQDILTGAFMSFIKSCPLVSESVKNSYTGQSTIFNATRPVFHKYSSKNYTKSATNLKKDNFIEYLDKYAPKHYSKSTARSYTTSVNLGINFVGKDLWEIDDPQELKNILDDLNMRDDFQKKNADTHNGLGNGLWRYLEFLEYNNLKIKV